MKSNLIVVFFAALLLFGCKSKEDSEVQVFQSEITSISSPERAIVGDNVSIQVNFTGPNGCTKPYSLEADKVGQTITLRAYYSEPVSSGCTAVVLNHSLNYSFFADLPGPYFFVSEMNKAITDTLTVY